MIAGRPLAVFVVVALAVALTAGFGLGLWLLLSRTLGLTTFGVAWLALVQVHGTVQLFGFAALFLMGVGLEVLPRFRGAPRPPRALVAIALVATVAAIVLRAVAQPIVTLPGRDTVLALSGALLVVGTGAFAIGAVRSLAGGTNPHRPDEIVMAAGVIAAPAGALLVAIELPLRGAPLLVDPATGDRAVWVMLLGSLATAIFGVWARITPAFVATPPARLRPLLAGAAVWDAGVVAAVAGAALAGPLLLVGIVTVVWSVGLFGGTIARQRLPDQARLTRLTVRSAFVWGIVGAAALAWFDVRSALGGGSPTYLEISAGRHAFALGFVTLMIYAVAARVIPSHLGRRLWSQRVQLAAVVLANAGVALRVVPQAFALDLASLLALSGVLSYLGLVAFAANVVQTLRTPAAPTAPPPGTPVPMAVRLR